MATYFGYLYIFSGFIDTFQLWMLTVVLLTHILTYSMTFTADPGIATPFVVEFESPIELKVAK